LHRREEETEHQMRNKKAGTKGRRCYSSLRGSGGQRKGRTDNEQNQGVQRDAKGKSPGVAGEKAAWGNLYRKRKSLELGDSANHRKR